MAALATSDIFLFEGLRLDRRGLFRRDERGVFLPMAIGARALNVLGVLVGRAGDLVSREEIIAAVWPATVVEDNNLNMQIAALRRRLDHGRLEGSCIQTVAGRGYCFIAPVTWSPAEGVEPSVIPPDARSAEQPSPMSSAARRQLTIMFCDLVGSPVLAARLDPEDLRQVSAAFHHAVANVVAGFDGVVAKYTGDKVSAYFGYPQAHEDDAERAVRAALGAIEAVARLDVESVKRQARVGVATGLVVVGDLLGDGSAQEQSVVGATPYLAARLQAVAEPGTVIIGAGTRRLVGDLFEYSDLDAVEVEGIGAPVPAWRVLRPSVVASRFEALRGPALNPMIGRDEEIDLLLRRWARAKAGVGQVVLVCGEPGIGKSRIAAALAESLRAESHIPLRYFCLSQRADSAFHPIIGQIERAAGLAYDDKPQARLDKLDAVLARTSTSPKDAALFAEMLSLPNDGRYPALDLAAEQRRQRTLEALMSQLAGLARRQPVLTIFEDLHWIDPTSLEVLGRTVDRIKTLPALLIVTFRPEFNAPWVGQSHVTSLTLNRLGAREAAAIIVRLAGNKALPADVLAEIVERTDGIPLFVEEMTKAVLEAESEGAARRTVAAVPPPALAVPASLHASLMARLDRLGPAREVAQIGSAIGREFSHALLAAVARKPEAELGSALDRLVQAALLSRQGVPPQASYLFKHALVQDAAYGMLLREPRRALHARIAETLESHFSEIAESQPEILAHHCTEAGLIEKAACLWGKAGQLSQARSALVEAAAQFTRALDQIVTLPGTPALRREQIKLQVALITPLNHVKGFAATETKAAAERARLLIEQAEALGEPPEDPLLLFSVLYAFWAANNVAFNGDACRDLAAQFLALAEKQRATVPLMVGHRLMGMSLLYMGDIAEGRGHFDQAIALYEPAEHRALATRFGQDVAVGALIRSLALWLLGYPEAALRDADDALRNAREIGQAATVMYALFHTSILYTLCGNSAVAAAQAREQVALAEEKGSLFRKALGMVSQGCVLALTGRASDATEILISGMAALRPTGATLFMPFFLPHLARAHAELGQFEAARRCIGEAMTTAETTKEKWCEAEIHRTAGEIALMSPEPDAAKVQAHFERSIAIARAQTAKSWELRSATSLARLWRDEGKRQQARDLLAPVYGWFTEGFDTADLKEAKAMLEALA
jgi:class 3 adenylate cyclase/predicted ATPase